MKLLYGTQVNNFQLEVLTETARKEIIENFFAGREGISLFDVNLDFVFIEDTYPLTINQKIFRYRNNVEEVFIHLPQRSIQNALKKTLEDLQQLITADQSYLNTLLDKEKKKALIQEIHFPKKWASLKKILIQNNYKIKDKRTAEERYSIIEK